MIMSANAVRLKEKVEYPGNDLNICKGFVETSRIVIAICAGV